MATGYIIEHEGKQYDPNGQVDVADAKAHNDHLENADLAYWQTKPDHYLAYIGDGLTATTWGGKTIGKIIKQSRYRNSLTGSRMEYVRVAGNNGATYYGTYGCDWSQAVRLRKVRAH